MGRLVSLKRSAPRKEKPPRQRLTNKCEKKWQCGKGHFANPDEKECPVCRAIRQADWRKRHPVKYKAAQKKYYYESTGRVVRAVYQEAVQRAVRALEREEETVESGYVS